MPPHPRKMAMPVNAKDKSYAVNKDGNLNKWGRDYIKENGPNDPHLVGKANLTKLIFNFVVDLVQPDG
eukprot:m.41662 g.41662  ORF g.41662 m.41662 type:complete len:68 (-) comp7012_c0_seq1:818-1021(-)